MNKGDIVYVSGMNTSDCSDNGAWDDKRLREAYDRATKIAEETVAKRVAMETNTSHSGTQETSRKSKKPAKWCVGKSCRAIYEEDGMEYEAVITDIIDDKECVIKYLGYNDQAVVLLSSLEPSWGKSEVAKQIEYAARDNELYYSDVKDESVSEPTEKKKSPKSAKSKKAKLHMPHFSESFLPNLQNFPGLHLPMSLPMPPPMCPPVEDEQEQQALSSMLLSWYLSGYYSGLYQGMKNNKSKQRRH